MKRGAERQIAREDRGDEDNSEDEPGQGFKKADESVLSGRKIRALPKRMGGASAATTTTSSALGTSQPAPAFVGFGASTTAGTGFSFQPSKAAPSVPAPAPAVPSFSLASSTATPAAKTFASFLSSSPAVTLPPSTTSAPPTEDAKMDEADSSELDYYVSIRGLNQSFLNAVTKQIADDPFVDISVLFEKYQDHRVDVQKKRDTAASAPAVPTPAAPSTNGASKALPTPPAVPTSFAGFGGISAASTSSTPTGGGFTPTLNGTSSGKPTGFTFGSASTPSTTEAPKAAGSSSSFSFGAPAKTSADAPTAASSKPSFTFAGASAPTDGETKKSPFAFGAPPASSADAPAAAAKSSPFSFGSSSTPSAFSFGGASASASTPAFGATTSATSSAVPSGTTSLFGSPALTPGSGTPLSFGAPNPFGAFGKPASTPGVGAGSLGNPVGFGFGAPAHTADKPAASAPSAASEEAAPAGDDAPPPLLGVSAYDTPGEGEEDEDIMHEVRSKLYQLVKRLIDGAEKSEWADLGVGMLRLKKHKDTDARRMLMRNSSTGKILANFNLYSGLEPKQAEKFVSFIGHDDKGHPTSFRIRMKTTDEAAALKDAIAREVAASIA